MPDTDRCRECDAKISADHVVCPECGYDSRTQLQYFAGAIVALGLLVGIGVSTGIGAVIVLVGVLAFLMSFVTRATY